METQRFYNTLAEAKIGDFAFVENSKVVITKITLSGRFEVQGVNNPNWTKKFKDDGREINGDKFHFVRLQPYSEANLKAYKEYHGRRNAISTIKDLDVGKFSTDDLLEIATLIRVKISSMQGLDKV